MTCGLCSQSESQRRLPDLGRHAAEISRPARRSEDFDALTANILVMAVFLGKNSCTAGNGLRDELLRSAFKNETSVRKEEGSIVAF